MEEFKIGTCYEKKFFINKEDTALALGSGGEEVLATPRLVAWMENTAFEGLDIILPEENTTVGTRIDLKHIAASPVGMEINVRATLVTHEKRALNFEIEAWDQTEKIGEAVHQRFIVDKGRFLKKVLEKSEMNN
ncbi:thioesterase family protein [Acetobacterium sp.]|jgi:predicted thioesterase|uniref:thioesterase family protein n=1 Tax=Acetobacterium sp. TaxID=1872094 RepID=UPI000CCAF5AC|nr:thioesterase family protein [Acetobacterium sp.]MDO9493305.1 thioesterase family protein [Acetobacterium sp.]PKM71031.1 MAG: thioesterase [Firmicutes bacterium HGW-Firmicutes-17]